MKKLLLLVALISVFTQLDAQEVVCEPDTMFQNAPPGAFPMPLNNGEGGLAEFPACINEPYNLVFTIRLGDSVSIADCIFPDTLLGCILVTGTPTDANQPGSFPLTIEGSVLLDLLGDFPLVFPGILAPGEYILDLNDTGGCEAVSTSIPSYLKSNIELSNTPNPVTTSTLIEMTSLIDGDFQFKVFDMTGRSVHSENIHLNIGYNTLSYDASALGGGMYIYTLGDGNAMIHEKMMVSRN